MSIRLMMVIGSLLASFAFVGCGGGDGDDGDPTGVLGECPPGSEADQEMGAQVIAAECTECHSRDATNRQGAPIGIDFDVPSVVDAQAERMYIRTSQGTMPLGGGLVAAEIEALRVYLACGSTQPVPAP